MSSQTLLAFAAVGLLAGAPFAAPQDSSDPPGLVKVSGRRTQVGSDTKSIQALILEHETMRDFLVGETPQHSVQVDDFWLMVTEVTNEQYAAYVAATGARPPHTWGKDALEVARKQYFEDENERRQAAKAEGKQYLRGEPFDEFVWWEKNWEGKSWEVPRDIADHPINFVSFEDAVGYASWAGLRLMTEFEFQCAARGGTKNVFPWGDNWDKLNAASLQSGRDGTWSVGSFEGGAIDGIYDLVGNVWEWTSSPFVRYPGYKPMKVTIGKGKQKRSVEAMAGFDANSRVSVGGCYSTDPLALRIATRRNTARSQRTSALGFRCALSVKPGRDIAQTVWQEMIPGDILPEDLTYLHEQPTVLHRWTAHAGGDNDTAEQGIAAAGAAAPLPAQPTGYQVISGYDAVVFVPSAEVDAINEKGLKETAMAKIQHIGILYTTVPVMEPALAPGAYMVAFRGAGELPKVEEGAEPPAWFEAPGLAPEAQQFLFFDATGAPVGTLDSPGVLYDRLKEGSVRYQAWTPPTEELPEGATPPTPKDSVMFSVFTKGRQRNKGFLFKLALAFEPGKVDASWHSK
ncbi:MAG: formylglycine-generating enzyme family protein [Planctomycetota bacterium]